MSQKKEKYDLKSSKEVIGPLYPRLLDKQGREIDGFHREEADSEWPTTKLEHIDTDVKYWVARIVANTHRRQVKPDERQKEIIELAKALRAEGQEGSLVSTISGLTTFSGQYIYKLLPDEYKIRPGAGGPTGVKPSLTSEQKPRRKSKWDTSEGEKLKTLYDKVEKSVFIGQTNLSQLIIDAKSLGLNVEGYEGEAEGFKNCLQDSLGRRYEDVKDGLNNAYKRSTEIKKALSQQIEGEEERREKLKESIKGEATEAAMKEGIKMAEKERIEKLLEEIPEEFKELKDWVREGFWSIEQIKALINNPRSKEQIKIILEKADKKLKENVKTRKTSLIRASMQIKSLERSKETPIMPIDEFSVIYADPPWQYDLSLRGAADNHYATMTQEDINALKIPAAKDAVLYLWATAPKIKEALETMEAWGFEYRTNMVWIKDKIGIGYWVRGQHELLLIGGRGDFHPPPGPLVPSSVINAPRGKHSEKPDEIYTLLEKIYPNHKYLELFAKPKNKRIDWTYWGIEA